MPSLTVEGIILKRANFGEADRMLTILTKTLGKVSVVARGVRKITSRRAGNVELLNLVKVGLFKGKGYTLTEAQSVETFPRIKSNLALSTAGFHILELANKMLPEDDANFRAYDLIVETLRKLENNPRQLIVRAFEIKFLSLLGFFSTRAMPGMNQSTKDLLNLLNQKPLSQIEQMEVPSEQIVALEQILRYYIEQILESKLKSYDVMKQLKK
jgi:recombinational DNA repair protein (RecF pathway)